MNESPEKDQRHRERMERKKAVVDEKIAQARDERGVLLVHSGNGKGKSSSAFGMVARALGHGMKVGVVQFIKGAASTGEEAFFRRFPEEVSYHVMGEASPGRPRTASATSPRPRRPGRSPRNCWPTRTLAWWCWTN